MIYHDPLSVSTPGACANCGARVSHLIHGRRCRQCHEYRFKYRTERPARLWQPLAPVWGLFRAEESGPNEHIWCDCGKVATQTLTLPISGKGKTTLLLCDACAALERSLAPCHSWAGG